MNTELLTAALSYAQRGWLVIPLHTPSTNGCSCHSGPACTSVGKHPRTQAGLSEASKDEFRIRGWWSRWPDANVGILTGAESGLVVIDVDNKNGRQGGDNLAGLVAELGGMPATLGASTGSGEHLYFKHPGVAVKNSASQLADGVDVRAERGYVVAAPSLHANGTTYAWRDPDQPLAELPSGLLARLTTNTGETRLAKIESKSHSEDAPRVNEGERNNSLYKVGCALRGQQGMERSQIVSILLEYNLENCDPPLKQSEVTNIADSACQHPAERASKKSAKRVEQNPLFWFQFNTRDWFSDQNVMLMSDAQTGWYIRLRVVAWDNGGFLPADKNKLWKLAKAKSRKAFENGCALVLADYEYVDDDGEPKLKNLQMAVEYARTLEILMKKIDAGNASKRAKLASGLDKAA